MVKTYKEKFLGLILDEIRQGINQNVVISAKRIGKIVDTGRNLMIFGSDYEAVDFCVRTLIMDLRKPDKAVWADFLNYAYGTDSFEDLKAISPFAGMVFVRLTNLNGNFKLAGEIDKYLMSEIERRGLGSGKLRLEYAIFLPLKVEGIEIKEVGNGL